MAEAAGSTRFVTGKVRLAWAQVFEPNEHGKYQVTVLVPKSDKETIAKLEKAIEAVKALPKSARTWGGKYLASFKIPMRDGDTEVDTELKPEYKGHYFFSAATKMKPDVVDTSLNAILDKSAVYSGCYVRISVNLSSYSVDGGRGINAYLQNVQKLADGEPLGSGGSKASDDFEAVDDDFLK